MKEINLPVLPTVALMVMRFDPGAETSDSAHLEGIIGPDKGISAELLKVANSAYYGRSGKINSIRDAVTLLGVKAAKNLVVLMITRNLKKQLNGAVYQRYLTEFPVVCALIAQELAIRLKKPEIAEEAFVAGLLHRIGMTILALDKPEHYDQLLGQVEKNGWDLAEMENGAYKTDHHSVTEKAFVEWKLPADLTAVAKSVDFKPEDVKSQSDLTLLTALADVIAAKLLGLDVIPRALEKEKSILDRFGLPVDFTYPFDPTYYEKLKEHPFYRQAME